MTSKKGMAEFLITCIISTFILGGAVFQGWKKMKSEQKAEMNDSLRKEAEKELKKLQREQLTKQSHLLEKADSIILSNQAVIAKQEETIKKVMGYGYALTKIGIIEKNQFKLFVESKSDCPLYETEIVVYDQDQINNCPNIKRRDKNYIMLDCYNSAGMEFPIFTLNIRKIRPLGYVGNLDEERHILIKITTKHNVTYQYSILKLNSEGNDLIHFYRVYESNSGQYKLLEKDNMNVDENIFEKHFSYRKDVPVLFN